MSHWWTVETVSGLRTSVTAESEQEAVLQRLRDMIAAAQQRGVLRLPVEGLPVKAIHFPLCSTCRPSSAGLL